MCDDWVLMRTPQPEDEKFYDIKLDNGSIIYNVEYWAFGGGFKPAEKGELPRGQYVHYLRGDVVAFRNVKAAK